MKKLIAVAVSVLSSSVFAADCTVNGLPQYGESTNVRSVNVTHSFAAPSSENLEISLEGVEHGFIAYPAALGEALFYDLSLGFGEGGWDGITWFEDYFGAVYEPVVMEIDGTDWLIYRTDFPGVGDRTFFIDFENAGLQIGDTISCDYSHFQRVTESEFTITGVTTTKDDDKEEPPVTGECVVSDYPRYGIRNRNFASSSDVETLTNVFTTTNNQEFAVDQSNSVDYVFIAYPAALGRATFVDTSIPYIGEGGWEGATWPDNGDFIFDSYEPIVITRDGTDWYVYRTDFPGVGNRTWSIEFENAGLNIGDSGPCADDNAVRFDIQEVVLPNNATLTDSANIQITSYGDSTHVVGRGEVVGGEIAEMNLTSITDGTYDVYVYDYDNALRIGPVSMEVQNNQLSGSIDLTGSNLMVLPRRIVCFRQVNVGTATAFIPEIKENW